MYVSQSSQAAQLTKQRKQQIRRNEQIRQDNYNPPNLFRLIKVGSIKTLEQGDTVLGKVKVVTTKKIACQLIYVEFKGLAQVDFNVPSTTMIDEIQNFHKEWEFFSHKIPVLMHEKRGYNFLEPGIYEFYFKARVPIGGPCTFLTDIASVTYRFSGVFVRNDVTVDVLSENHLTYHVCGYKDLNPYYGARVGFWQEKITYVGGFLGFLRGTVEIRVKTNKRAFIPGEKIYVVGEVVNTTCRRCTFSYELIQIVKMWGDHYFWRSDSWGSRHLKDELVMERGKIRTLKSGDVITLNESLLIPKGIEPSYLGMTARDYINDLINLKYVLRFDVNIPYSPDLRVIVPIIIGTEPFMLLPPPPGRSNISLDSFTATLTKTPSFLKYNPRLLSDQDEQLDVPFRIPRFHPLNPNFQKKFPETFATSNRSNADEDRKSRKDMDKKKHEPKCVCSKKSHRKKHRSACRQISRGVWSDSSTETGFTTAATTKKTAGRATPQKVDFEFGNGVPTEECTYVNWLSASIEDHEEEEDQSKNFLFNVMRQYGLVSQMNI